MSPGLPLPNNYSCESVKMNNQHTEVPLDFLRGLVANCKIAARGQLKRKATVLQPLSRPAAKAPSTAIIINRFISIVLSLRDPADASHPPAGIESAGRAVYPA